MLKVGLEMDASEFIPRVVAKSERIDSYIIQGKAGYELQIKGDFSVTPDEKGRAYFCNVGLFLSNEDREKLVDNRTSCFDIGFGSEPCSPATLSWLSDQDRTYYILIQRLHQVLHQCQRHLASK